MTVSYKKVSIGKSNYYLDGFSLKDKPADENAVLSANWLILGIQSDDACKVLGLNSESEFVGADVDRFRLLAQPSGCAMC